MGVPEARETPADHASADLAPADLARDAMEEARAAVDRASGAIDAERDRISRELHDIVSHSVTVMVLQAAGAERILDVDGDHSRTRAALRQIEKVGAQAMDELGRMLRVLRAEPATERAAGGSVQASRPGVADVGELVAQSRSSGLAVDLVEDGEPGALDPSVGLAAYRVVQECLTNATKHGGSPAVVRLQWSDTLRVEVVNGPRPASAAEFGLSTGHGLLGLRERVAVVGGQLETGQAADGGFRVCATLPLCRRPPDGVPLAPASAGRSRS